jgi:hypothetical protein
LNIIQRNIIIILISFSVVAFIVFFILSLKIFDNNNYYYVLVENATGLNESDMVYIENESVGKIKKIDTIPGESGKIRLKITLNRNVNLPSKTKVHLIPASGDKRPRIEIELMASSGYYNKRDTLPLFDGDKPDNSFAETLIVKDVTTRSADTVKVPEKPKKVEPAVSQKSKDQVKPQIIKKQILFKVQFMVSTSELPINSKKFEGVKQVSFYIDKGIYKYVSGNETDISKAISMCESIKKQGFQDAFVVAFDGDKRISIKEAEQLLKK